MRPIFRSITFLGLPGPTPCISFPPQLFPPVFNLYKGDAYRGTYRTSQSILAIPDAQTTTSFLAMTGPTRNYGAGSPVNLLTLSSFPLTQDIYDGPYNGTDEDGVQHDCFLWNDRGHAETTQI
jgi:hypothetical protein